MRIAMLLFVIGLAFSYCGYGTAQGLTPQPCFSVSQICSLSSNFPALIACTCSEAPKYPNFPCLQTDVCNYLKYATNYAKNCSTLLAAIQSGNEQAVCDWFKPIIDISQPQATWPIAKLIDCICNFTLQTITDQICTTLKCLFSSVFNVGYFLLCSIISSIKQLNKKPAGCLCDILRNLITLVNRLIACGCNSSQPGLQACLNLTICGNNIQQYLININAELANLEAQGLCPPNLGRLNNCPWCQ